MSRTLKIVNGPSKFELMLGLLDWKPKHRLIGFTLEGGIRIEMWIQGISAEDGSGESWNLLFTGRIPEHLQERAATPSGSFPTLNAWYRTDTREGKLFFR